jgi:hypothetical protein
MAGDNGTAWQVSELVSALTVVRLSGKLLVVVAPAQRFLMHAEVPTLA